MISLGAVSGEGARYYAADNYYTANEGVEQSEWCGKAAEELGLSGKIDAVIFEDVLLGKLPDGTQLEARRGELRPGLDMTFSASKSVSLLALVGGDKRIVAGFREAVVSTLKWMEKNLAETRVWNGLHQVPEKTGNLLAATFLHDVNRNREPQLHIHAVIANATMASDGKWHALRNDELYIRQHTISAVFNAELRNRLEALGYQTVPARNPIDGAFEIAGVSREVVEAFSTRSQEIREALEASGRSSPRERELATLATRRGKETELDPDERGRGWALLAERHGFDAKGVIGEAIARAGRGETMWSRIVQGMRGIGARGKALAAAMGLTPREGDALVPERLGRLEPSDYAAAQAVASASREMSEREAGFDRLDLVGKALDRIGPVTAGTVEKRIDLLVDRGLLRGSERMLTPESSLRLEQAILGHLKDGQGAVSALMDRPGAVVSVQKAAREMGLRGLNAGQLRAAVDILSGTDRTRYVQGGAGVGKSAALGPVAAVARAAGHPIHALAVATRTAREFGEKVGAPGQSIASFLARHRHVLDGTASADSMAAARTELGGAFLMVDEASMVPNHAFEQILRLGSMLGAERVIMAGDTRQLLAVEAGKPFDVTQRNGAPTSHVTENMRAGSPLMKAVNAALEDKDVSAAFALLKDRTLEVAGGEAPGRAADQWVALSPDQRDKTVLLALSRSMRGATNTEVQERLRQSGEIGSQAELMTVLDRVTVTREGARQMRAYREGHVVQFNTNLTAQGFARGERGVVLRQEGGCVSLQMSDGAVRSLEPDRLAKNLKNDAVSIYQEKQIAIHQGDRVRWTDNDTARGLLNNQLSYVHSVSAEGMALRTAEGAVVELKAGDHMLEKLDLAYALTVHAAQGMTSENAILVMREEEKLLNSARAFMVAATRVTDGITLVVDNAEGIEKSVIRNVGDKTSALDIAGEGSRAGGSEKETILRKPSFESDGPEAQKSEETKIDLPERYLDLSL